MIHIITTALIAFIEKELITHAPEIEAAAVAQLELLAKAIMDYINNKEGLTNGNIDDKSA